MDPTLAAMTRADPTDRMEYATVRALCPDRIKTELKDTLKLAVLQKLSGVVLKNNLLLFVATSIPEFLKDALSPRIMGYTSIRGAMAAALATAPTNNLDCDKVEAAASLYNHYTYDMYVADICSGTNTLKDILSLLKPVSKQGGTLAVSEFQNLREKETRLKLQLKETPLPVCYPCLAEWFNQSLSEDVWLALAISEVMTSCPVTYQTGNLSATLTRFEGGVAYLDISGKEVPAFLVTDWSIQNLLDVPVSGPFPVGDAETILNLKPHEISYSSATTPRWNFPVVLGISFLTSAIAVGAVGFMFWRKRNDST